MKRIIFKRLNIHNFKGVENLTIDFNPEVTNILGANHTGKTTTADAIHWVLFGKSSEGLTVFGIDPKDEQNNIIHHLDNEVSLTLEADGKEMVLTKVRTEKWSKVRGHDEEELTGHETTCFIDGNKYTINDYTEEINKICPEVLFRAITNPAYFPSLKADDQRTLLVKMVDEKSLEEIAGENKEFKALLEKLNGEDLKAYRQHLNYQMQAIKKQLTDLPSRISENQDILQQLKEHGINFDLTRKRIEDIDKGIENYDKQLQDSTAILNQVYEERMAQRTKINGIKGQMKDIEEAVDRKNSQATLDHEKELSFAKQTVESLKRKITSAQMEIDDYQLRLQHNEDITKKFRDDWANVEAEEFSWDETQETCPTCGQRLPEGNIEKIRNEAEERFSEQHMAKQDELDQRAAQIKKSKSDTEALIKDAQSRKADLEKQLGIAQEQLGGITGTIIKPESAADDQEWRILNSQLAAEQAKLLEMADNSEAQQQSKDITVKKAELMKKRDELRDELAKEGEIKEREKRIEELQEQMKQLGQQLTNLEQQDSTAEQLEHASIEDLQERVNGLFKTVKFQMFQTQLNGSVKPTCVMTMHGVPYPDLSNSEKILAGIECIQAMSRFNNIYAPVISDNAEAVNNYPEIDSQLILLFVSTDKQLTVVA